MKKIIIRTYALLSLIFVLAISCCETAFAATLVDWNRKGSITVTLRASDTAHSILPGAEFKAFQVAELTENGYALTDCFQNNGMEISDMSITGLAKHLTAYAENQNITALSGTKLENGSTKFEELPLALYLIVQEGSVPGYHTTEPFLVTVPMTNLDGSGWAYDIISEPKTQIKPSDQSETGITSLTAKKVWVSRNATPDCVTVALLKDNAIEETVILNRDNHWTYTWKNLDKQYAWSVVEIPVPEHYIVVYSKNGTCVTITNTNTVDFPPDTPPDNPPQTPSKPPSLIQTGQLNWPIPLLAIGGLILASVGWTMVYGKRKHEDE